MHDNEFSELKGSEKRFKALFKSSPLPIFVWRREGDDFVRFDHNDAAQDLAGGIADRATGMMASELLTDWPDVIRCMRQCFAQRKTVTDVRRRSIPRAALPRWFETTCVFVLPLWSWCRPMICPIPWNPKMNIVPASGACVARW